MREKIGFSEAKEAFDEEKKDDPKRVKKVVYKDSSQGSQEEFQESYAWWYPNVVDLDSDGRIVLPDFFKLMER